MTKRRRGLKASMAIAAIVVLLVSMWVPQTVSAATGDWWVMQSTYSGQPTSYWKYMIIGQETLPVNPVAGGSDGGPCDKIEVRAYSDAVCTVAMEPSRVSTVTIVIKLPAYDWRHVTDRQLRPSGGIRRPLWGRPSPTGCTIGSIPLPASEHRIRSAKTGPSPSKSIQATAWGIRPLPVSRRSLLLPRR